MRLHLALEAWHVQRETAFAGDVAGEVYGEAIGIVQTENRGAGDGLVGQTRHVLFKDTQPLMQGLGEAFLFLQQGTLHLRLRLDQLRVGGAHLAHQGRHQFVEEWLGSPQAIAVTHGAPHDTPQHIAAAFVGGQHPIDNEKRAGTNMIGDNVEGFFLAILDTEDLRRRLDQTLEQIDVVVAVHALHHRADALQPHAGIHGRFRQRVQLAARVAVVLHEH